MQIAIPGRLVLFDYGDVISEPQSAADTEALVAESRAEAEPFWRAYHAERNALDHGLISSHEYWARIGRACGSDWDEPRLQRLWSLDVRSWVSANAEVVRIIGDLRAGGTRMALLSNAAAEYGGLFRFSPLSRYFEQVFVSGEMGLLKPDPAIYVSVADELGMPPERIAFIDNREANIRGAESVGMSGHVFTHAAALRSYLDTLGADATRGRNEIPPTTCDADHRPEGQQ
ncbi:HAD family hydrolase [uncultured Amnibacterium sp.]|uniref:HAD family hydrolase n=1 Tax=uncultured Amnibacterium sp. TaxID=1631851 RepID=UPI0035CC1A19